jgi:hypothetical protein
MLVQQQSSSLLIFILFWALAHTAAQRWSLSQGCYSATTMPALRLFSMASAAVAAAAAAGKAGFVGSCDEVCLVDNGSWTSYNSC